MTYAYLRATYRDVDGEIEQIRFLLGHESIQPTGDASVASGGSETPSMIRSVCHFVPDRRGADRHWPSGPRLLLCEIRVGTDAADRSASIR
jgi:hypothetical protein